DDVVGAKAGDLFLGSLADSLAHGEQPDNACHADENTQNGQRGSQRMEQYALDAELNCPPPHAHRSSLSSESTCPSRSQMIRRVCLATSGSCVTMMIVRPSSLRRCKRESISSVVLESRLPVGSS